MKPVLIITYYWPPAGGAGVQRMLKFCKYLPEFGIKPIVLVPENPIYPITDETLSSEISAETEVHRCYAFEPFSSYAKLTGKSLSEVSNPATVLNQKSGSTLSKLGVWIRANIFLPDGRIGWVPFAIQKAQQLIRNYSPEAVITSGTPHSVHLIGKSLKNTFRINWIADFRDPWTDIHYNQVLPRTNWAQKFDQKLELSVLQEADSIITVSDSLARVLAKKHKRRFEIIPNGFDRDDFESNANEQNQSSPNKISIHHVGTLPETSVPHTLFQALAELPDNHNLEIIFTGTVHASVHAFIEKYNLENVVKCEPYIPFKDAATKMKSADALLLIIPDVRDSEGIMTGKIFNYLGAGRPVIMIGPEQGDAAKLLNKVGNSLICEHDDLKKMKSMLENLNSKKIEQLVSATNTNMIKAFNRREQTQKLHSLIVKT